jgi:hypothetical protein
MPFTMKKVRGKRCYSVFNTKSPQRIHSKCTTKNKAQKQLRLLRAIIFNKNFKLRPKNINNLQANKTRKIIK